MQEKPNARQIIPHIDATLLKPGSTFDELCAVAKSAQKHGAASLCIAPCHVKRLHSLFPMLPLTTVVGFPLGYSSAQSKLAEAELAIAQGAAEIDAVINPDEVKSAAWAAIAAELKALRRCTEGKVLKIIIETCQLTQEEKKKTALLVQEAGADYVKTSTGFGSKGAELEDVLMLRRLLQPQTKIKAAGGIRTLEQMQQFLQAGAERIGSSTPLEALLES